ncbi:hypothetical protein FOL46_007677 [Perkinsus olseni]|uniref:Tyrosine-protein kinase ephrin type A/B receptor-like domain-containing protein n=1 Tax=Perkinsus olseni TaxID=32597 RepID=A0A7J6MNV8_PEROL|nr:hypothetical protein FOL46_007677 [Perkinsus olseni]
MACPAMYAARKGSSIQAFWSIAILKVDVSSAEAASMSWVASEDGEVVYSGENYGNPDIDSVLRLQDNWLSDGEVRFVYMVDGEDEFDGFRFMVDGVMMLGPEYTTVDDDGNLVWKEGSVSLEAGPHTLEWVYSKDMSEDYGYDRAWIRSIELLGTRTVDLECLPCPPGDQRLLTSTVREQCLFCGRDEYPDHNTSVCQQCPPGQYAAPGDSSCSVRPPCTAEDYSIQYSDCDAATWKRTGRYGWSSPIVCDSQLPESVPLPTETITTACEDCPTGSYLDPQEGRCIRCPAEMGKIATAQGCAACPDGQVPAIESVVDSFPALWSLPFRFRGGSWQARQESLATELTDHLTRSVELTWRVEMLARGVLKVNYSVQVEGETPPVIVVFFGARAGQEPIRLTPFDAARGVTVPSREVTEISIRCEGPVGSKFTFTSFSLSSSRGGGAAECHPCDPGQALVGGSCQECPQGQFSSKDGAACRPCSANTYTSHEGSAACLPCPNGMVSEAGADSCTMSIGSDLAIGDGLFDLKALSDKGFMQIAGEYGPLALPDGRSVYFDPIAGRADMTKAVVAGKCAASASPTAAEGDTDRVPIGKSIAEVEASGHGIGIVLVAPAEVGACQSVAAINLICDPSVVNKSTYPVATLLPAPQNTRICGGQYVSIGWHLAEACRLCSPDDYVRTVSECTNGTQRVSYVLSDSLCMVRDEPPAEASWQSCESGLPWYFILGIAAGCLALVSSLLYVLYLQRRWNETYGAYMKLREHVGPQMETRTEPLELGRSVITYTMEEGPDPYTAITPT